MGAALLLALTSIYAGVFNVGRLAQIVLAAGATMAVVLALTSAAAAAIPEPTSAARLPSPTATLPLESCAWMTLR